MSRRHAHHRGGEGLPGCKVLYVGAQLKPRRVPDPLDDAHEALEEGEVARDVLPHVRMPHLYGYFRHAIDRRFQRGPVDLVEVRA